VPVPVPPVLRRLADLGGGMVDVSRDGLSVRVTTLERTMVDILDAPRHGGGWEEIWRSLESVEFFDIDAVTDYALKLGSAVTVAKVGFFLEQHRDELMLDDKHLARLQEYAPSQPMYLERGPLCQRHLRQSHPDISVAMGGEWFPKRAQATPSSRSRRRPRRGREQAA
jgi:hypothetical protein